MKLRTFLVAWLFFGSVAARPSPLPEDMAVNTKSTSKSALVTRNSYATLSKRGGGRDLHPWKLDFDENHKATKEFLDTGDDHRTEFWRKKGCNAVLAHDCYQGKIQMLQVPWEGPDNPFLSIKPDVRVPEDNARRWMLHPRVPGAHYAVVSDMRSDLSKDLNFMRSRKMHVWADGSVDLLPPEDMSGKFKQTMRKLKEKKWEMDQKRFLKGAPRRQRKEEEQRRKMDEELEWTRGRRFDELSAGSSSEVGSGHAEEQPVSGSSHQLRAE